jgi:hypothetical protein
MLIKKLFPKKRKAVASTPFSEFIRNASSEKKKKVYTVVLQKATERQVAILTPKERTSTSAV